MSYEIVNARRTIVDETGAFTVRAVYEVQPPFTPGDGFFGEIEPGKMVLYAVTADSTIIEYFNNHSYPTPEAAGTAEAGARDILSDQLRWIREPVDLDAITNVSPNPR